MKKILFDTRGGGLGRQIMATAVAKQIRAKYPDAILHVLTSYPEAFAGLAEIDRYFGGHVPYFYEEHKDFEVLAAEPYLDLDYRQGKAHLIDVWCRLLGVDAPKRKAGIIALDMHEKATGAKILSQLPKDRKVVAFQWQGGTSYMHANEAQDPTRVKHYRDLGQAEAQAVVNQLSQMGYVVIQIGLPSEPQLENAVTLDRNQVVNPRYVFAVLELCDGLVAIDSFAQHAWSALGKKDAVVIRGGTGPVGLGYSENSNITSAKGKDCPTLHCARPNTHMGDFCGNGRVWTCPKNAVCMAFDAKEIVESLKHAVSAASAPAPAMQPGAAN
jgi:hypothetical protein